MALEQPNEQRLLTTDEAEELIELYAAREEARRKEAERLAALPKLSDVANLLGVTIDDLRPLLARIRSVSSIESEDVRMTQEEADFLIELHGREEHARQAELERRAQMTSLKEVADGLNIPLSEAEGLLRDIRNQRRQSTDFEPAQTNLAESDLVGDTAHGDGGRSAWRAVVAVVACIALVFFFARLNNGRYASNTVPQPPFFVSEPPSIGTNSYFGATGRPDEITPFTYVSAGGGGFTYSSTYLAIPEPPKGWTVRIYGHDGYWQVESTESAEVEPNVAKAQLRECVRGFLGITPAVTVNPPEPAAGFGLLARPSSPFAIRSSDLGWRDLVEVTDGKTTRAVYMPRKIPQSVRASGGPGVSEYWGPQAGSGSYDAQVELGLDHLVGNPSSAIPMVQEVPTSACLAPTGTEVTLFIGGHVFRTIGDAEHGLVGGSVADELKNTALQMVSYAEEFGGAKKGPEGQVVVYFYNGTWSTSVSFERRELSVDAVQRISEAAKQAAQGLEK